MCKRGLEARGGAVPANGGGGGGGSWWLRHRLPRQPPSTSRSGSRCLPTGGWRLLGRVAPRLLLSLSLSPSVRSPICFRCCRRSPAGREVRRRWMAAVSAVGVGGINIGGGTAAAAGGEGGWRSIGGCFLGRPWHRHRPMGLYSVVYGALCFSHGKFFCSSVRSPLFF